ncbi:hypothetical protein [Clostridium sp. CS001]|nr:hypothetical protein [Clostridium sp. CS001]
MKDREKNLDIKHKKSYEKESKESNPVTINGDSNMRKPVRGLK